MKDLIQRRQILRALAAVPALTTVGLPHAKKAKPLPGRGCSKLRISLNAYSFNDLLSNGHMSLQELFDYCANVGFDAVDITAYYFPGYPDVPPDSFLYEIKRQAFLSGLEISGTGVRNDFTDPDPEKRKSDVQLVKNWIEAAEKLGAPVVRIFAGNQEPQGYTRDQITSWMVDDIHTCIEHGKRHGVVVAVQNHHDFLKTADQVERLVSMVDSEWFGVILDTGSYRQADPYDEIAKTIPYAVNWQVKEKVFIDGEQVDTDMDKLVSVINALCYRGYLPIETLGPGDPKAKVAVLFDKLRRAILQG
ncbi:MAG: sugar phosphate isomerase/epimerase [Saprospiraceae bacterium]|nr:sugar phosphate isomerase/epimerase [Saprospiraceae bacterium]